MTAVNVQKKADPFRVLGVSREASEDEIRERYLELVKQFPPERDPQRFREIRAAYETAKDPLALARVLLEPPSDVPQPWAEVIEEQRAIPPRMSVSLLLSLGNQNEAPATRNEAEPSDT